MSDETWKQVVIEKDPATMKPADVASLGPPPREITPQIQKYVKTAKPSFAVLWIWIAILSVGSYAMMIGVIGLSRDSALYAWWPLFTIGAAVWTVRGASRRRETVRRVLRDGGLRFARLTENRQIQVNRSAVYKKFRYDAVFDVDGRRVRHSTMNDGMSMLNRGQLVEVVYNPDVPDEIVPTFLLV